MSVNVKVACRIRSLIQRELSNCLNFQKSVFASQQQQQQGSAGSYCSCKTSRGIESFLFDHVFDTDTTQSDIYTKTVIPLLKGFFDGFNVSLLAYGQTGSGKTYTLGMNLLEDPGIAIGEETGVLKRLLRDLFNRASSESRFKVTFIEIYQEQVFDLLSSSRTPLEVTIHQSNNGRIFMSGLQELIVDSVEHCQRVLLSGLEKRTVAETAMNAQSSRSHAIFTITMEQPTQTDQNQQSQQLSKFQIVDLAGSERQAKTQAQGERLREGCKINYGLFVLGNVITILSNNSKSAAGVCHVPYRDSKLTRILQDCLGGNSLTLLIACVTPAPESVDETLSTLQYASRARKIRNEAKRNVWVSCGVGEQNNNNEYEDPVVIGELERERARLRSLLATKARAKTCGHSAWMHQSLNRIIALRKDLAFCLNGKTDDVCDVLVKYCRSILDELERRRTLCSKNREITNKIMKRDDSDNSQYESLREEAQRLNAEIRSHDVRKVQKSCLEAERGIQRLSAHKDNLEREREKLTRQKTEYTSECERTARFGIEEIHRLKEIASEHHQEMRMLTEMRKHQETVIKGQNAQLSLINREMRTAAKRAPSRFRSIHHTSYSDYRRKDSGSIGDKLRNWFDSELDLFVRVKVGEESVIGDISRNSLTFKDLSQSLARIDDRIAAAAAKRKRTIAARNDDDDLLQRRTYQHIIHGPARDINNCKILIKHAIYQYAVHDLSGQQGVNYAKTIESRRQMLKNACQGNQVQIKYFEHLFRRIQRVEETITFDFGSLDVDELAFFLRNLIGKEDLLQVAEKFIREVDDVDDDEFLCEYVTESRLAAMAPEQDDIIDLQTDSLSRSSSDF